MITLSDRLNACAGLVYEGSRLCDVGTDHGYVPAFLIQQGHIPSAVACDINKGPLSSCIALVDELGYNEKIKCVLSNGLDNVSADEYDDVLIAGMGGELICDILSRAENISEKHIVINAMTHPELVREWLYSNGFEIENDIIVKDGGHFYSVFDAIYTGEIKYKCRSDYFLGEINDFSNRGYFDHLINYLKNKQKGGMDYTDVINAIEEKL